MKKKSSGFLEKFLPFAGICGAALVLAAFILLLATNGVVYNYTTTALLTGEVTNHSVDFTGNMVLFGGAFVTQLPLGFSWTQPVAASAVAMIAWIIVAAALAVLIVTFALSMAKVKIVLRLAGLLNLGAAAALIVGGVLLFFVTGDMIAQNQDLFDNLDSLFAGKAALGTGWLVAAILSFVGALVAAIPGGLELFGNLKNKK